MTAVCWRRLFSPHRFLLFERSLLSECPRLDVVLRGRETRPFLREVLLGLDFSHSAAR